MFRVATLCAVTFATLLVATAAQVSTVAAAQLGFNGPTPTPAEQLVRALKSRSADTRMRALENIVHGWAIISPVEPLLSQLLKVSLDDDARVRAYGVRALGVVGPPDQRVLAALTRSLSDADEIVRISAAESLIRRNPDSFDMYFAEILAAVKHRTDSPLIEVLITVQRLGQLADDAVPHLLPLLKDAAWRGDVLATIAGAARTPRPEMIPPLASLLADQETDAWVRAAAASALAGIGRTQGEAENTLLASVKDANPDVRAGVLRALEKIELPRNRILPVAIAELADKSPSSARIAAVRCVAKHRPLPEEAIRVLIDLLRDEQRQVSGEAFDALREAGDEVVPLLVETLGVADPVKRGLACSLLAFHGGGGESAIDGLLVRLDDESTAVRKAAIGCLASLPHKLAASIEPELRSRSNSDQEFAKDAAVLLWKLSASPAAARNLVAASVSDDEARTKLPEVRFRQPEVLFETLIGGEVQSRRAALLVLCQEDDHLARQAYSTHIDLAVSKGRDLLVNELITCVHKSPASALPEFITLLESPDSNLRESAAIILREFDGRLAQEAARTLLKMVRERPLENCWFSLECLARRSDEVVRLLMGTAQFDPDPVVRARAVRSLGRILQVPDEHHRYQFLTRASDRVGPTAASAVKTLSLALEDPDEDVVATAREALRNLLAPVSTIGDPQTSGSAPTELIRFARDADSVARESAVRQLGMLGRAAGPEAADAVEQCLYVFDNRLAVAAAIALTKIDPQRAREGIPLLIDALNISRITDLNDFVELAEALARIGPPASGALPDLTYVWARSPVYEHHQAATEAIGRLAAGVSGEHLGADE